MLDAAGAFRVAGVDGVVVHPDDQLAYGFYALAQAPRVTVGPDGTPELDLTVYGRRENGVFTARGALLTLTTVLGVSEADLARLRPALVRRVADAWPADAGTDPPAPLLLAPDWAEAEVRVEVVPGLTLTGSPSLGGDNRCSFSTKLSADQAREVQRAWAGGLTDAVISYRGRLRTRAAASVWTQDTAHVRATVSRSAPGPDAGDAADVTDVRATGRSTTTSTPAGGASTLGVEVSAPLAASVPDLDGQVTTTEL